jgi:hypothetical protein
MNKLENEALETFSFSNLTPSVGDLARMPEGTTTFYEVNDFKHAGNIQSYAKSIGGKLSTAGIYYFNARDPNEVKKLLRVEVVETAPAKQIFKKEEKG